ncbi:MAG: fatty acid desaturase [Myxococcales bacterium]|nr:MAG: fatty acid desaturase [Myxococcales bacterium]
MTLDPSIDYEGLGRELDALRAEVEASLGPDDYAHLRKIEGWGKALSATGYATAWLAPNPLSMWCIAHGSMVRWTMMAHHVSHRGYDRVPGVPARYTSKGFATGSRRLVDWFDWIHPDAWKHEHNVLHHFHTSELDDPDLVEENTGFVRNSSVPHVLKTAAVALFACTWKWTYYAPNTFLVLQKTKRRRAGDAGLQGRFEDSYIANFNPLTADGRAFWKACILPYGGLRFGVIPALFLPLGPWASFSVLVNSLGAEVMTNLYTFLVIASNHAGDDLYRFETKPAGRGEFYARQILCSVNYALGNDRTDFLHGWLNYQIEHHLFPDLPMRQYQRIQPRVKAIAEKYGIPYVQESVFKRAKKLVDIMTGATSMKRATRVTKAPARPVAAADVPAAAE